MGPLLLDAYAGRVVPEGVGRTALGVARVRAYESRRPDRLFEDPYAEAFVAAAPDAFPEERNTSAQVSAIGVMFAAQGIVRTRFYDDYLLGAGCRQVVLLAAGLDTRAYRLGWPAGTRLYELDLPDVLEFKERVLAERRARPRCERTVVPVDLREDWATPLVAAGLDRDVPTAWLAEGLLIYLSREEASRLLTDVGRLSAPYSHISCEYGDPPDLPPIPALERYQALWKGGLGASAPDWLAGHGWRVEVHDRAALAVDYGRPELAAPDGAGGFVTAVRAG